MCMFFGKKNAIISHKRCNLCMFVRIVSCDARMPSERNIDREEARSGNNRYRASC